MEHRPRVAAFAARADADDITACRDFAVEAAMAINARDNLWSRRIDEIGFLLDARGARIRGAVRG